MKANVKKNLARVLCAIITVCLLNALAVPAFAAEANQAITDAKSAVVQIQIWYVDPEMAQEWYIQSGTGFLINESTVITCYHVVNGFNDQWYKDRAAESRAELGIERTAAQIKENLELRVSVLRDVHIRATIRQGSSEMDYAILNLADKLHNRTTLPLRSSSDLKQTESVYALGFPGDLENMSDQAYYDPDDVTITTGTVNKVARVDIPVSDMWYENVDCVEHSAQLAPGNSGGPLVDASGAVVGINAAMADQNNRNLSVASDQLIATLEALGIPYNKAGEVEQPVPTEDPELTPTEEPDVTPTESTNVEPTADVAEKEDKDDKKENKKDADEEEEDEEEAGGIDPLIIILGVVAVAVVAVIVVVVVVLSKGKSKEQQPVAVGGGYVPPAPPVAPPAAPTGAGFAAAPVTPATNTAPMEVGETTVLSQDAGETTVLSRNVNGGSLIRKRNGEKITISNAQFVIGRDRKVVNYCISDNSSISRKHVTLEVRGEVTYLVDLNAANGTFVNGVKALPRQEIALKDGDKITLSDEDFEYKK